MSDLSSMMISFQISEVKEKDKLKVKQRLKKSEIKRNQLLTQLKNNEIKTSYFY